jgi:hypothetical protein
LGGPLGRGFTKLAAFRRRARHANVPPTWSRDPGLAAWVARAPAQRRSATRARAGLFCFEPWECVWEETFAKLEAFRRREGHASVPASFARDPTLASWVQKQGLLWRRGKHERERLWLPNTPFTWKRLRFSATAHRVLDLRRKRDTRLD